MEFLKAIFGDGTLNYEDFVKACNDTKIKLADLSKGEYISKDKYSDELQSKDTTIKQLQDTIKTRDVDIKNIKEQLNEASMDSDKLSKLQGDLGTLQQKYATDTKAFEDRLSKQAYEFAVKEFASSQKFTSKAAKREFIHSMIAKDLKMDGATIVGANDFVKSYIAENEDSFVKEEPKTEPKQPAPKFAGSTNNQEPKASEDANKFNFAFTGVRSQN